MSVALLAPNALQALKLFGIKPHSQQKGVIARARGRLVSKGLLSYDNKGLLHLTVKGQEKLRQLEVCEYKISKPKRWDNKWRIIIFDIKEEQRLLRNKIRNTLVSVGFVRLQNSVFVYPYDCEDLITLLKADFKIGKNLLYIIADTVENDTWLKKQYNLS